MKTEQIVAIWNNISEKRHYFCLLRNARRSTSTFFPWYVPSILLHYYRNFCYDSL